MIRLFIIIFLLSQSNVLAQNKILSSLLKKNKISLELVSYIDFSESFSLGKDKVSDELEGVLAHELSHVKNRDILVSTIAVVIGSAISIMSRSYMWGSMFGGSRNRNTHPALLVVGMIAAPIAAMIIQFAISRTREFGADSTGADITGNPLALASALEKIDAYSNAPLQVNPAVSTLFISDPYKAFRAKEKRSFFSTHPPTAERVRRLREGSSGIRYR